MLDQPTAGLGHNNPPDEIETLKAKLEKDNAARLKRTKELLAGVDRMPNEIKDADTADKATAFIKQLHEHRKECDGARSAAKKPYDDCAKAVQTFFKDQMVDKLDKAKVNVQDRLDDYAKELDRIRREEERKERERLEAERKAKEAEIAKLEAEGKAFAAEQAQEEAAKLQKQEAKAEKKAATNTQVRSNLGATASLSSVWSFEIEDLNKIDLNQLRDHFTQAEIEKALRSFVREHKGERELSGVRIFQDHKTRVR
ncbi:hypothetical protein [Terasakiella pusilla]|uniref:hypothetical protein n=1 Tax=Terasakiella pusilla TaxID=64973 RepID=UPI003AA80047